MPDILSERVSGPRAIVSGGQTGVDRAALDLALDLGLAAGGWCPAGRWAEDGAVPRRYPLRETSSADPAVRTRRNVRDSDATLILSPVPLAGGTALTARVARTLGRPCLALDPRDRSAVRALRRWLEAVRPAVLNVAGPRASEAPGLGVAARRVLGAALRPDPGVARGTPQA